MKLKTCKNIQIFLHIIGRIIMLPLLPIGFFGYSFLKIYTSFDFLIEEGILAIGNKMLRNSDEVKNGVIKNKDWIENSSALTAWKRLELELRKK